MFFIISGVQVFHLEMDFRLIPCDSCRSALKNWGGGGGPDRIAQMFICEFSNIVLHIIEDIMIYYFFFIGAYIIPPTMTQSWFHSRIYVKSRPPTWNFSLKGCSDVTQQHIFTENESDTSDLVTF